MVRKIIEVAEAEREEEEDGKVLGKVAERGGD